MPISKRQSNRTKKLKSIELNFIYVNFKWLGILLFQAYRRVHSISILPDLLEMPVMGLRTWLSALELLFQQDSSLGSNDLESPVACSAKPFIFSSAGICHYCPSETFKSYLFIDTQLVRNWCFMMTCGFQIIGSSNQNRVLLPSTTTYLPIRQVYRINLRPFWMWCH